MSSFKIDSTIHTQHSLFNALMAAEAATLQIIADEATAVGASKTSASEARQEAEGKGGTLWTAILSLAEAVESHETAAKLDGAQTADVLAAMVLETMKGKGEAAAKSVKSYTATAKRAIVGIREKKFNWHQYKTKMVIVKEGEPAKETPVSHEEVRTMLKAPDQRGIEELRKTAASMLGKIAGRENDVRNAATRRAALEEIIAFLKPMHDAAVKASDDNKKSSALARAVNSMREDQQHNVTSTPTAEVRSA